MKVGDLIRLKKPAGFTGSHEDIGVVTHVHDDEFIDVLFSDGEYCVDGDDYEVVSEAECR